MAILTSGDSLRGQCMVEDEDQRLSTRPTKVPSDATVVTVRPPVHRRRRRLTRFEWGLGVPLMVFALLVLVAIPVVTFLYAVFGTQVPFLVNAGGDPKGPAPIGQRVVAAVLCVAFTALWLFAVVRLLQRLARPALAVTGEGVWLARGRRIEEGVRWSELAAVAVTTIPTDLAIEPPYAEFFPVARVTESHTPLGRRVENGRSPAPGLRGKRYVIGVHPTDLAALTAAIDLAAPGLRLTARN